MTCISIKLPFENKWWRARQGLGAVNSTFATHTSAGKVLWFVSRSLLPFFQSRNILKVVWGKKLICFICSWADS